MSQGFEASGDVDCIAMEVLVLDDYVAEVYADTELEALFSRQIGVMPGHRLLPSDSAAHRLNRAGELDQQPVADGLDEPAMVPGDKRLDQLPPADPQQSERALLIGTHQERIAGDVSRQDRKEPAFDLLRWRSL
jgi:hypothetical protein